MNCSIGSKTCYMSRKCSCLTSKNIKLLASIYRIHDPKVDLDGLDDYEILSKLKKKIFNTTSVSDIELLNHAIFMDDDRVNRIVETRFLVVGPLDNSWLSNYNIDLVMGQYENFYSDFKYMGTQCIDFNQETMLNSYRSMRLKYKKFGCIYNTDPCSKSGKHWIASYVDIDRKKIYFYDSVGTKPPRILYGFMRSLADTMFSLKTGDSLRINDIQHQYGNSECGVYCMYFIRTMLDGMSFKKFCNEKINDYNMNKNRKLFFRRSAEKNIE